MSNAAYSDREFFCKADMAGFRRTIDVTMWGAFYGLRASANQMIRQGQGGSAVVISSPHALHAMPSCMAYNMAKSAPRQHGADGGGRAGFAQDSREPRPPRLDGHAGRTQVLPRGRAGDGGAELPWGRLAKPEEIARGVLFLVDPESDYITGSTLSIDGGSQLPWWSKRGTGEF